MDDEYLISGQEEISILTNQLSYAILNSDEYRCYQEAQDALREDPELYNRVNELRRSNYALQNAGFGRMTNDEYMNISNLSRSLREDARVSRFLNAEVDLARIIQDVTKKLVENINFDIDFL